jgi:hypothetical protein
LKTKLSENFINWLIGNSSCYVRPSFLNCYH